MQKDFLYIDKSRYRSFKLQYVAHNKMCLYRNKKVEI